MADRSDVSIFQGDHYSATVTVRAADGSPADITGYTATAQIRRAVADVDPVIAATFACVVASPNIDISLTPAQTVELSGMYVWDLQIVSGAGIVTTILAGRVRAIAEVTRAAVA